MWRVRGRRAEDLPSLAAMLREVHEAEHRPTLSPAAPESWPSPTALVDSWVLVDQNGALGGHLVLTWPEPALLRGEQLFVSRTARDSGAGRVLLDAAIDRADRVGAQLRLDVAANCRAGPSADELSGWQLIGRRDSGWGDSRVEIREFRAPFTPPMVEPAEPTDAEILIEIREAAARWQQARGLAQWVPGEVSVDDVRRQIASGGTLVVRSADDIVASLRLVLSDEEIWGHEAESRAGYVHGLMVSGRGTGLGRRLLRWAERETVARGCTLIRLDCVSSNTALRGYYRQLGFREVGSHTFAEPQWSPVTLFEKTADRV